MRRHLRWGFLFIGVLGAADFEKDIRPLFAKHCVGCHGPKVQMNGFRLDNGPAALKGGYSGPALVPGRPEESRLFDRVTSDKEGYAMPPNGARLMDSEVRALREWITEGARFPAASAAVTAAPAKSKHWAWQPLPATFTHQSIDAFVRQRLARDKLTPAPEADRPTLLRRVSLDLRGLPPSPEEMKEFLADRSPDAYERMVDRFLSSPHYGERWARPWLDLARYADSDGFEKDLARPWAWRYRHWVINALNANMPFDQFTIEQLAGDLLPNSTVEQKVATGFHRMTLYNREAGVSRAEDRFEQLVNRTNTIATTWLGLTSGCAQCHDHKYDPLSQREYYQLMGFLNNAHHAEIEAPLGGELGPWLREKPIYDAKRAALLNEYGIAPLQTEFEAKMSRAIRQPGDNVEWDFWVTSCTAMLDDCQKLILTPPAQRTPFDAARLTDYFIANLGPDLPRDKPLAKKIGELRGKLNELARGLPRYSRAMVVAEAAQPAPMHVAVRGDHKRPGVEVPLVTPAFLPAFQPKPGEPARLAFARWLVSAENPVTPRVIVNRAWQEFFGRGLVRTSEDFGTQGDAPTHPELLDFLARDFQSNGWNLKRLHRTIVTSATYKQSSHTRPELAERDPENTLLARQQRLRLSAELIRDSALTASGLLNPAIGGPSVRPPQPAGVTELGYGKPTWKESDGMERYRRGLYVHFQRTTPYPMLMTFDMPDSNVACSRRRSSNTPLQALNLLNDPVFNEAAAALAARLDMEASPAQRLEHAFLLTLGRAPSPNEKDRLQRFLDQQKSPAALGRVLLNLDEFITRE